eukprot:15411928-Heterocapsa_arctica.AAC.1
MTFHLLEHGEIASLNYSDRLRLILCLLFRRAQHNIAAAIMSPEHHHSHVLPGIISLVKVIEDFRRRSTSPPTRKEKIPYERTRVYPQTIPSAHQPTMFPGRFSVRNSRQTLCFILKSHNSAASARCSSCDA